MPVIPTLSRGLSVRDQPKLRKILSQKKEGRKEGGRKGEGRKEGRMKGRKERKERNRERRG
jgi:hypothetical protein